MKTTKHDHSLSNESDTHQFHGMKADAKALKITGWLTGIYFIIELALGFYSGSVAVISDAFHTFSAVGGVLIALIANKIASRPPGKSHTFGLIRAEIAGALLNGLFLLLMAVYVLWMGYTRLKVSIEIPTNIMFISAIGGLITEFISMGVMWKGSKNNLNMKGAFWHVLQTFVGSIIIIIAALVIKLTGWYPIDPILGMLFGLVLFVASIGIIKESFNILLESTPKDIDVEDIVEDLRKIKNIEDIHHVHAWALTTGKNLFMAHLKIKEMNAHEKILEDANKILKQKYNIYFSTLQVEEKCPMDDTAEFIDYLENRESTPQGVHDEH
ncbi:cation diffusion facilitator family transporter [Marinicella rhabdoformis]|uniref:cation diffusion facilitator family transporter n=1 Tax=Marinicella rhabdoformis TaxID=2580566 RepID=UPI001C550EC8|nr:cation diffusion facilitator family transporter [Marinicella rhabdoformis]